MDHPLQLEKQSTFRMMIEESNDVMVSNTDRDMYKKKSQKEQGASTMHIQIPEFFWNVPDNTILIGIKWNTVVRHDHDQNFIDWWNYVCLWKKIASGIHFCISKDFDLNNAHIVVEFVNSRSCSMIGSDALNRGKGKTSMYIRIRQRSIEPAIQKFYDKEFKRNCVHEFGHALGFHHGHIDPEILHKLDLDKIKTESPALLNEILEYINDTYDEDNRSPHTNSKGVVRTLLKTSFDHESVMNYMISEACFKDEFQGEKIEWYDEPSIGDLNRLKDTYST